MDSRYSIKDLEHLSGIKAHTIRAWESRYKLIEPKRTETNIRYYADDDLKRILNISALVKRGMRISKVASMTDDELKQAVLNSGRYDSNFGTHVNALKAAMLDFDEHTFDAVVSRCIVQYGVEKALIEVVGAFIKELSLQWQVGAISVSHEHFASNLLKMKLFALVDQAFHSRSYDEGSAYILYLPAEEYHELSLLYLYYDLVRKGNRVVYLGQSVPLEYLREVSDKTGIREFVSVLTTSPSSGLFMDYVTKAEETMKGVSYEFHLTGRQCEVSAELSSKGIHTYSSFEFLREALYATVAS